METAAKPDGSLINGVRICRAVLVTAAVALVIDTFAAREPYFAVLALGCVVAAFVRHRSLRSVLAGVAAVEGIYFFADMFSSAQGGSVTRDVTFLVSAALVSVAILRLRHWENALSDELPHFLTLAAGAGGVLLVISAAFMAFGPISSSQLAHTNTNSQCGSIFAERSVKNTWDGIDAVAIANDCHRARHDRAAFTLLELGVGIAGVYAGLSQLRRQPRKLIALAVVAFVGVSVGGGLWTQTAVHNANEHNAAVAPWITAYASQFDAISSANSDLRAAVASHDAGGVINACNTLMKVDDQLAPSVNAWPARYESQRDDWQRFVREHHADAQKCVTDATASEAKTNFASSWFDDSSATIASLRHTLTYW